MRLLDSLIALSILVMIMLAVGGLFAAMSRSFEVGHDRASESIAAYGRAAREFAENGR